MHESSDFVHFREIINQFAADLGDEHGVGSVYCDEISGMSDINAIRFLQKSEGNTDCFGRDVPLHPGHQNSNECDIADCVWKRTCDSYRGPSVVPIDKVLDSVPQQTISDLCGRMALHKQRSIEFLSECAVGLQMRSFQNISAATRKMLIASPQTVVGEYLDNRPELRSYILADHSARVMNRLTATYYDYEILFTSDLDALIRWFSEAQLFCDSGNIAYYPMIYTYKTLEAYDKDAPVSDEMMRDLPRSIEPKMFSVPHICLQEGDILLNKFEYLPILHFTLPVIENIDFNTLYQLMSDFPKELTAFRSFFYSRLEELRTAVVSSVDFAVDCRNVEREIRERIRKIHSDCRKVKLNKAFSLTGCSLANWALSVYCFRQEPGNALSVLGPEGDVCPTSIAYSEYLTNRLGLKDSPVYFLWLLGESKR